MRPLWWGGGHLCAVSLSRYAHALLIFVHFCTITVMSWGETMKREQLLRLLKRDAKILGQTLTVDMARGKGGHCVARCNGQFSVIKSGEITPTMEKVIRKQLGLDR